MKSIVSANELSRLGIGNIKYVNLAKVICDQVLLEHFQRFMFRDIEFSFDPQPARAIDYRCSALLSSHFDFAEIIKPVNLVTGC